MPQDYTLPFSEYIEDLISNKEFSVVDSSKALRIKAADPAEEFCHVEFPGDLGNNQVLPRVWRIKTWKISYQNFLVTKERAAKATLKANLRTEKIKELCREIKKRLPIVTDDIIRDMAIRIFDNSNEDVAQQFGVSLTLKAPFDIDNAVLNPLTYELMKGE